MSPPPLQPLPPLPRSRQDTSTEAGGSQHKGASKRSHAPDPAGQPGQPGPHKSEGETPVRGAASNSVRNSAHYRLWTEIKIKFKT